ncbi:MAG: RimJ/RimL family protein N-acetyltransferase [Phenylobacterium sp.]|jgi:RimJ/RimL family protein N-acetyltransferase
MQPQDSSRLSYALMTADDIQLMFDLDQDPEVMRYINGGTPSTMTSLREVMIPRMQSYSNENKGWGLWKVTVKQDQQFIGWVLVRPMDFFSDTPAWQDIELGWRFKQSSWGKGYATEAASAIKDALIAKGDIEYLSAIVIEGNAASINIMEKLGMSYIKTDVHKDPLGDMEVVFYQLAVK